MIQEGLATAQLSNSVVGRACYTRVCGLGVKVRDTWTGTKHRNMYAM